LNCPVGPGCIVAETEDTPAIVRHAVTDAPLPLLANDWNPCDGIRSLAAAPVRFRASLVGVLAVADGERTYTRSDLDMLEGIGCAAVAEYESLERAEALGMLQRRESMAELIHDLRQPLGILEACAFLLDVSLPPAETRSREQLAVMMRQLDRAGRILNEIASGYAPPRSRRDYESESRVLTKSAMSMVT
jgi:signal transduction histidine kinase